MLRTHAGATVATLLDDRFGLVPEMTAVRSVVFALGPGTDRGDGRRLVDAYATLLEVRRGGVLELSVRNSLLEVERLVKEPHRSLQALNIDMDSLEIGDTSIKESLGLEQEELIGSLKRQRVSVSSVQIGGFKLIRKCPGDQFYQKLQTGKVSRATQ